MKTLAQKFLVKPGHRVLGLNVPAEVAPLLDPLPDGATIVFDADGRYDVVLLFVRDTAELERLAPAALAAAPNDTLLWIAYPKQSSGIHTDINRDRGWEPVTIAGRRPVAQIAVDATWSALRFRPRERVGR